MSGEEEKGGVTPWKNAIGVEYRNINPECAYCGEDVTVIRVASMVGGESFVSTLCAVYTEKEIKGIVEDEGFRKNPKRSSFYNSELLDGVSNEQAKMIAKIFGIELFIAEEEDGETAT